MKTLFTALFCCVLCVAGVSAQQGQSVVEAPDSGVALASAQDETTPTVPVPDDGSQVENQASATDAHAGQAQQGQVQQGHMQHGQMHPGVVVDGHHGMMNHGMYQGSGCGCGSSVVGYAAPSTYASSACCGHTHNHDCCGYGHGGYRSRPQVVRGFRGRWGSSNRYNGCCY